MLNIKNLLFLSLFAFVQTKTEIYEKEFELTNKLPQDVYYKYVTVLNGKFGEITMSNVTSSGQGIIKAEETNLIKNNGFCFNQENVWGNPIILMLSLKQNSTVPQIFNLEPNSYNITMEGYKFVLKFNIKEDNNSIRNFLAKIPQSIKAYFVWLKSKFYSKALPDKK